MQTNWGVTFLTRNKDRWVSVHKLSNNCYSKESNKDRMYILQRDLTEWAVPILQSDHMVPTRTYFLDAVTGRQIGIKIEKNRLELAWTAFSVLCTRRGWNCSVLCTWRCWNCSVLYTWWGWNGSVLYTWRGWNCSVLFSIPGGAGTVLFSIPGGTGTVLFCSLYLEGLELLCSVLYTWKGLNCSVLHTWRG